MMNRPIRLKKFIGTVKCVTQSKFNPCKREIVCLAYSYLAGGNSYTSGHVLLHSINWLAKHKTLNDFTVYLRNIIFNKKITEI